jgi:transcriptional regulator with XRE-family HTH domain
MKIGHKIKELRTRQRLTLKELAKKTGLTISFLSQLERDIVSPSISSVEKIASTLNTKISYFFEERERKGLIFIKKDAGKKFFSEKKKVSWEILVPDFFSIKMKPKLFTLKPGAEFTKELICPEGERFGMVLKGKIEFLCGEEKFVFEEGDSIYCAYSQKIQRAKNIGKTKANFLWIVLMSF